MATMDWAGYLERVTLAEKSGNQELVDLVADRALSAVVNGARSDNANVFVRSRKADLARRAKRVPMVELEGEKHAPSIPCTEDIVMECENERTYWADLGGKVESSVRRDASGRVLLVARLLAAGYSAPECARVLGVSQMSVSRAKGSLATILG